MKKIIDPIWMMLKLICFQALFFTTMMANNVHSQNVENTYVSFDWRKSKLEDAFTAIQKQTNFFFTYDRNIVEKITITGHSDEMLLSDFLNIVSGKTDLQFSISSENIFVAQGENLMEKRIRLKVPSGEMLKTTFKNLQSNITFRPKPGLVAIDHTLKGTVKAQNGDPLVGATVSIKGTTIGTTTNENGEFSLVIPDENNLVLEVWYLGYESKEIFVADNALINIILRESPSKLNEIVVIGYGEQTSAKVVGTVSKIAGHDLQKVAAPAVDQQLAGKLAGVIVNQPNGQPGASAQIVIRGTGTLTAGTNPLIVVDGFPLTEGSSLNAINPNDVEDINILKDAASAAIYGSRAANGVVLITTKKGVITDRSKISLSVYSGFQQQSSGVKLVDAYDFVQFLSEARDWGYVSKDPANRNVSDPNAVRVTKKINGKSIDGRELRLDDWQPYLDGTPGLTNTNWMNEAFRNARMQNYDLSFSGGNEKKTFYVGIGYFDQDGVVIGTNFKKYTANIRLENRLNDKIKVGINLLPSFTKQNIGDQGSRSSGALSLIALSFPTYAPYKADGSLNISEQLINETRKVEGVNVNGTPVENLVVTALKVKNNLSRFKSFGNAYLSAELLKGLTYKFSMGGDYDAYYEDFYYPSDIGAYRIPAPRSDANGSETKQNKVNYLLENTLTYHLGIKKHSFNLLGGYTFQKETSNYSSVIGTGFPDNNLKNVAGASAFTVSHVINTWALESYLGRVQYDFDAKYLFSAAFRTDGSSRFGKNNRWGYFPSVGAGWVLSREAFFPHTNLLNFAKLSASWGKTGNNQIGNYSSQALVTGSNYVYGTALAAGYISTTAPNPDLGWEVAAALNVGVDLGLLRNKLNINVSYYKTNTKDLLLNVPVPQQTGYNTVLANIGEMENKGFEFQVAGNDLHLGDLRLTVNANLTTYANKVLALGPGQKQIATGTDQNFVTKVGGSIAEIYGYNITGIYKTQDEINSTPHLDGTYTGDYIVEDVNKDGKIDVNDKVSKGNYMPDMTYGFGSVLSYKGWSFSFNFMGISGRTLLDGDMSSLTEAGEGFAVPTQYYFDNRYHPVNNPDGSLGQPNFGNFSNARKLTRSSVVVEKNNGDYFRLRDVQISYDFPKAIIQKSGFSQLQVYVSGNNVFTRTKFRGWNPDGTTNDLLTSGYNSGSNYPIAKTFLVGIKATY